MEHYQLKLHFDIIVRHEKLIRIPWGELISNQLEQGFS